MCLQSLGQSSFGCFCVLLSAMETGSVSGRQMEELYWKIFDEFFVFEGKFQTLTFLVIFVLEQTKALKRHICWFNIFCIQRLCMNCFRVKQVDGIFMCFDFLLVPLKNAWCCTATTVNVIKTWRLIKHKLISFYTCTPKTVYTVKFSLLEYWVLTSTSAFCVGAIMLYCFRVKQVWRKE